MKFNFNCWSSDFFKLLFYSLIGNVVFSLKTHCYKDDEFSRRVVSLFSPTFLSAILSFVLPTSILEFFDLSLFDPKTVQYLAKLCVLI